MSCQPLEKDCIAEPWYHGLLPREDLKSLLVSKGNFIVRTSEPVPGQARKFILSVMCNESLPDGVKHFVISHQGGKYFVASANLFDSIQELIGHYQQNNVDDTPGPLLGKPIPRQFWELSHENITLEKTLGEGAFGEVKAGKLKTSSGDFVDIAVKVAKLESLTKEQIKEIMREARLMRNINHKNIVRFFGVAAGQEPLMVVMELVCGGGLDSYLKKNATTPAEKMNICLQAAEGVEYLHKEKILHRDIAARNCLYGNKIVKVSDFGLSRVGETYQMDPTKKVPIRWLSPEVMRSSTYSVASDVFAFGILVWEVYHDGQEPYPGMSVPEVHRSVNEGYRMDLGGEMQGEVATMVKNMWLPLPQNRPAMADIVRGLKKAQIVQKFEVATPSWDTASQNNTPSSSNAGSGDKNRKKKKKPDAAKFLQGKNPLQQTVANQRFGKTKSLSYESAPSVVSPAKKGSSKGSAKGRANLVNGKSKLPLRKK